MKKPGKGKPRRPRGPRKKSRKKRKTVRQHVLYARRWAREFRVPRERILLGLEGEPNDEGQWEVDAGTGDDLDNLLVDTTVRSAMRSILETHESL